MKVCVVKKQHELNLFICLVLEHQGNNRFMFVLYSELPRNCDMKHSFIYSIYREYFLSGITNNLFEIIGFNSIDAYHRYTGHGFLAVDVSTNLSLWLYLALLAIFSLLCAFLLLWRLMRRQRKYILASRNRNTEQLRFIRILLDLCYTYQNSPLVFLDKFKDKVNIRELKSYDLIEIPNNRFVELKEDEKLLCLLLENGFTQRELCVIFNLKKINNLYIKYNRIRKKMVR